jgi:hypothetical protein
MAQTRLSPRSLLPLVEGGIAINPWPVLEGDGGLESFAGSQLRNWQDACFGLL